MIISLIVNTSIWYDLPGTYMFMVVVGVAKLPDWAGELTDSNGVKADNSPSVF